MTKRDTFSVLIPDGESTLSLFAVMGLSQIKGLKIYVMSTHKGALVSSSKKINQFYYYENIKDENKWVYYVNDIVLNNKIDIIMPVDSDKIRFFSKNINDIPFGDKLTFLPEIKNFKIANNKDKLAKYLLDNKLPHPKTVSFKKTTLLNTDLFNFPIIYKDLDSFGGGQGVRLFQNKNDLECFFRNSSKNHSYLIQEYIEGYDIDCSVLCKNGKILAFTIQKGILPGKNKFSPNVGVKFLYEEKLYQVVKNLMKSLNWSGVAHIDMRYDSVASEFKIIEINPRFWESLEASIAVGVNFPYLICAASLGKQFKIPEYKHVEYFNLLGLAKLIRKNVFFLFNFKLILKNTSLKFYKKDPFPFFKMLKYKYK